MTMKKNFSYAFALALGATLLFSACKKDEETPEPTPDECATLTYPTTNGTSTVNILNFTTVSGGFTQVNASAGDNLSFAFEVIKGDDRPQKLRVYQTECENAKGTQVLFEGQQDVANDGTIDLRNTDDAQVRQVVFAVPTGVSTLYLNVEVDESGSKYTYKRIKLNISGSGIIDSYAGFNLGAQGNALPSRASSTIGQTYTACNSAGNLDYVDIVYSVSTVSPFNSYISSNVVRPNSPISVNNSSSLTCGDETLSTVGGPNVYFKASTLSTTDFDNATDATLTGLTVASTDNQYAQVTAVGNVFEFLTIDNRKGLIKITAVSNLNNTTTGEITFDVKVQR
jgi:hypothetical protein